MQTFSDHAGQKWISVRERNARSAESSWQELHSHHFIHTLILERQRHDKDTTKIRQRHDKDYNL